MSLILGKKHKITYFQYKKWLWNGFFFTFITVLGMSKIRKNIGFDAFLVFEQHQIYIFSPSFTVRGCFCPIDFHYNDIFWLQSHDTIYSCIFDCWWFSLLGRDKTCHFYCWSWSSTINPLDRPVQKKAEFLAFIWSHMEYNSIL